MHSRSLQTRPPCPSHHRLARGRQRHQRLRCSLYRLVHWGRLDLAPPLRRSTMHPLLHSRYLRLVLRLARTHRPRCSFHHRHRCRRSCRIRHHRRIFRCSLERTVQCRLQLRCRSPRGGSRRKSRHTHHHRRISRCSRADRRRHTDRLESMFRPLRMRHRSRRSRPLRILFRCSQGCTR